MRIQPRARRLGIEGVEGEVLKVKLTAAPEGGKANGQLAALLAKELKVPKSSVRVVRGASSRNKLVEVEGLEGL